MTNDLLLSSDRGCIPLLVLLDLSAAFSTIDHNILLNILENFVGISGSALAWFKQRIWPPSIRISEWRGIIDHKCSMCRYSAQLYISSRPGQTHQIEKLMECIVDIKNWMTNNFLLLNSEKTKVLIIGPKNHTSNNLEHYLTLDGCSLNSLSFVISQK